MKLSVVLPCYNPGPALGRCLTALHRQDLAGHTLEVVVVDDGSTDGTAGLVEAFEPRLPLVYAHKPRTPSSGRAAARNTGIGHATGDLIVMIDPDHVFPPDFLARHAGHHERRPDLVLAGPRQRLSTGLDEFRRDWSFAALPPPSAVRDVRRLVLARLGLPPAAFGTLATRWYYTFSCNLSVRREHLLAVGGFDTGFTGWGLEDSELGYRLHRHGLSFAFDPDAVLYTWERGGMTDRRYTDWRRNLAHFTATHPGPDVALLRLLDDTFNPGVTLTDGLARYVQFEHAAATLPAAAALPTAALPAATLPAAAALPAAALPASAALPAAALPAATLPAAAALPAAALPAAALPAAAALPLDPGLPSPAAPRPVT